jgi:hypothetical protein
MEHPPGACAPAVPQELAAAAAALARISQPISSAAQLLSAVRESPQSADPIRQLKAAASLSGDSLERLLLWQAAQESLPRIASLPIPASVQARLSADIPFFHANSAPLDAGSYNFIRAAKMTTLRLFPAGPMDWELSGIPRSWLLQPRFFSNPSLLWFLATRLRGLAPCIFFHVAPYPKNRALVLEKEVLKSYHRMARALELQPAVRAVLGHAWFFDPAALRDYPSLEPLNRPFLKFGGIVAALGPAPPDSGVLEGNAARRRDVLEGRVQYRYGLAAWPRHAAIDWARAHPELSD